MKKVTLEKKLREEREKVRDIFLLVSKYGKEHGVEYNLAGIDVHHTPIEYLEKELEQIPLFIEAYRNGHTGYEWYKSTIEAMENPHRTAEELYPAEIWEELTKEHLVNRRKLKFSSLERYSELHGVEYLIDNLPLDDWQLDAHFEKRMINVPRAVKLFSEGFLLENQPRNRGGWETYRTHRLREALDLAKLIYPSDKWKDIKAKHILSRADGPSGYEKFWERRPYLVFEAANIIADEYAKSRAGQTSPNERNKSIQLRLSEANSKLPRMKAKYDELFKWWKKTHPEQFQEKVESYRAMINSEKRDNRVELAHSVLLEQHSKDEIEFMLRQPNYSDRISRALEGKIDSPNLVEDLVEHLHTKLVA